MMTFSLQILAAIRGHGGIARSESIRVSVRKDQMTRQTVNKAVLYKKQTQSVLKFKKGKCV